MYRIYILKPAIDVKLVSSLFVIELNGKLQLNTFNSVFPLRLAKIMRTTTDEAFNIRK